MGLHYDIDKLDELPKRISGRRQRMQDHDYDYGWWGDYSRANGYLNKVNFEKYVGHPFDKIYSKYKHRLSPDRATLEDFCAVTGISRTVLLDKLHEVNYGGQLEPLGRYRYYWKWRDLYVDCRDGIIKRYKQKKLHKRWKARHGLTKEERLKQFYEERAASRKRARDRKKQRQLHGDAVLAKMRIDDHKRRAKERELNELTILRHGFCPETSFRNSS